ncbi:MAG: Wzz/FepE/Etk N-terminal domain-containing protein [Candidatus Binatia bacterium]
MAPHDDSDGDDLQPTLHWQAVLEAVFRRRRLVLTVLAVGLAITVLLALFDEPVYRASAKLMITPERSHITVSPDPKEGVRAEPATDQDLNAEVALLHSPTLIHDVLERYRDRLVEPPPRNVLAAAGLLLRELGHVPGQIYRRLHGVVDPDPLDEWVRGVEVDTEVTAVRGSNLIEATYTSPHPGWTAELLNRLVDEHVARHAEMHQQATAQEFLGAQRDLLHERLEQAEGALKAFYAREGIDSVPEQGAGGVRLHRRFLDAALADTDRELAEATAPPTTSPRRSRSTPRAPSPAPPAMVPRRNR